MAGTKEKNQVWKRKHHKVTFALIRAIFKPFFRFRYKLKPNKEEKNVPSPALIMANHQTTYDQFMLMCSFKRPLYFIASEDLFLNPILGPLMKWFMKPISKSKSKSDLSAVRKTLKILKQGSTVALFPEGNRTFSGGSWEIDISTAKLAKMAKVPLVLYKIDGGFGTDPRWGGKIRRGKMSAGVVEVISTEQVQQMSLEELYQKIVGALRSNDYEKDIEFKSKKRAEYLERALYYCPNCNSFESLYSKGNYLYCENCEMVAEYTPDLKIKAVDGVLPYNNVYEWYNAQKEKLKTSLSNGEDIEFSQKGLKARLIYDKKWHAQGKANIVADKQGFKAETDKQSYHYTWQEIDGVTVLGKKKINFYLPDGKTLQLVGDKRFCGLRFLRLYEIFRGEK